MMMSLDFKTCCFLGGSVATVALATLWWQGRTRRKPLSRPPGPRPRFLFRNVLQYPRERVYETFTDMRKQYGDIIYMEFPGGVSFLTLSSLEDAEELLVGRANIYSGRPIHVMVNDLMGFGWNLLSAQPGYAHNENRKVFRRVVGSQVVPQYDYLIEKEAARYVRHLSGFSGDPLEITRDCVAGVIIKLAYGENIYHAHRQELIKLNTESLALVTWAFSQLWLPNIFPATRYLPSWFSGISFPKYAGEGKELITKLRYWTFGMVLEAENEGKADPSAITKHLYDIEIKNEYLRDATALMYQNGVDTTSAALLNFLFNMLLNPKEQKKIQEELDVNIGLSRTPNMSEVLSIQYLNAAWKESLRLNPPNPMGVPHSNTVDDVWKGYHIPKGTIVQYNIGYMMRDPKLWGKYGKLDEFDPGRFLPEINRGANELPDVSSIVFGFGRRICPGRHLAERNGILFVATVLSIYDILPVEGEDLPAEIEFVDQLVQRPSNLRCRFVLRR